MSDPIRRRKNPDAVRRHLMDGAMALAIGQGLSAVTVDAVAQAAGVTKGALFHHFPSKQALVTAVFDEMIDAFDAELDALMAADPEQHGRFTRAYLDSTLIADAQADQSILLWLSVVTDPDLATRWSSWMTDRLATHAATDMIPASAARLEAVRFAADGLCYGRPTGIHPANPAALHAWLRAQTFPDTPDDRPRIDAPL